MLELVAMVLLILWMAGLTTGVGTGAGVHLLLVGACVVFFFHRRSLARLRSANRLEASEALTREARPFPGVRPAASGKGKPKRASRPSAAA